MKRIISAALKTIAFVFVLAILCQGSNAILNVVSSQDTQAVAVHQLDDNTNAYTNVVATTVAWDFFKLIPNVIQIVGTLGAIGYFARVVWKTNKEGYE